MQYCPSCSNEISERALYCPQCGAQAKCKVCRDMLDLNARFCVSCGTPVGEGTPVQPESAGSSRADTLHNIIEFSEDTKSRRFRAEVSDNAITSVSQPLALFLGTRIGKQVGRGQRQASNLDEAIVDEANDTDIYEDDAHLTIEGVKALPAGTDLEVLRRIFRRTSDNKLKLEDSRLKQNSQKEFVKRLTVLFLFANELEGQDATPRSDLNTLLTDAKVYDGNARQWISDTDCVTQEENLVRLVTPGREYAQKVLSEYLNSQLETTWSLETKSRRRGGKGRSGEKDGETEEGSKVRKSRKSRGESYTAKVRMLFESRFFADGRTEQEVQAELERVGYKFELRRIREALLGLTKKNNLSRNQDESGNWVYKSG